MEFANAYTKVHEQVATEERKHHLHAVPQNLTLPLQHLTGQPKAKVGEFLSDWCMDQLFITVNGEEAGTCCKPNIETLLSHATPTPHLSPDSLALSQSSNSSCNVFEIPSSYFTVTHWNGKTDPLLCNDFDHNFCDVIPAFHSYSSTLTKMRLYTKGGHCNVHSDSGENAERTATVVLLLQTPSTGGDLVILEGDRLSSLGDMSGRELRLASRQTRNGKVQAAIYFNNVARRVDPVKSGVRLELHFHVSFWPLDAPTNTNAPLFHQLGSDSSCILLNLAESRMQKHPEGLYEHVALRSSHTNLGDAISRFGDALSDWHQLHPETTSVVFLLDHIYTNTYASQMYLNDNDHLLREGCLASRGASVELVNMLVSWSPHEYHGVPSLTCDVHYHPAMKDLPQGFHSTPACERLYQTPFEEMVVFASGKDTGGQKIYDVSRIERDGLFRGKVKKRQKKYLCRFYFTTEWFHCVLCCGTCSALESLVILL
jgi:hypothetical protein